MLRRQPTGRKPVKYLVSLTIESPREDTIEAMRSRMGLLNLAMTRVIEAAQQFEVTCVDYEEGVLELFVWTVQVRGIKDAKVRVRVQNAELMPSNVRLA